MLQKTTALGAGGGSSIPGGTRILPSRIKPTDAETEISCYLISNIDTPEFIADFRLFPENYDIDRYEGDTNRTQIGVFKSESVYFGGTTPLIGCTNPNESVNIVGYGNKHLNVNYADVKHLIPPKNAVYAYICACKPTDQDYADAIDSGFDPKNINIIGTSSWHYYYGRESLDEELIYPICIASHGGFNYKKGLRGNKGVQLYVFYKRNTRNSWNVLKPKPTIITISSHYYPIAVMTLEINEDNNSTPSEDSESKSFPSPTTN